jgi:hypothetical protein
MLPPLFRFLPSSRPHHRALAAPQWNRPLCREGPRKASSFPFQAPEGSQRVGRRRRPSVSGSLFFARGWQRWAGALSRVVAWQRAPAVPVGCRGTRTGTLQARGEGERPDEPRISQPANPPSSGQSSCLVCRPCHPRTERSGARASPRLESGRGRTRPVSCFTVSKLTKNMDMARPEKDHDQVGRKREREGEGPRHHQSGTKTTAHPAPWPAPPSSLPTVGSFSVFPLTPCRFSASAPH